MKLYKICIISLMLMGTCLQADATKEPVCKNTVECDKLIHAIEVQIDPLEKKGIENLTDEEFEKLDVLQDKILAAQRAKTEQLKAKTAQQRAKIAELRAKKAKMLKEQNKMIDEVKALLK